MTLKQLETLVKQGESETLEFKKTTANLSAAMETVCAFLNSHRGGTVLIGVKDDGAILGQDINDKNLKDIATEIKRIEPLTKIDIQYIALKNEKKVIVISVNPGLNGPYSYDGRSFVRLQSTTSRMTREQYEYIYHKSNPNRWESLTHNSCTINDLDTTRIKDVIKLGMYYKRIPDDAIKLSTIDILKKLNLIVDDKLTNAAVILFCKKENKQFIQSNLKLARFRGIDKTSFLDHKFFTGNAFDLYDKADDYLHFHLPVAARIEEGKSQRVETPAIPYTVLREAITNALVHRDYSLPGGSMEIARYDDRVEICNTGSLTKGISLNELKKNHKSVLRNPLIANVFFICGKIEKWPCPSKQKVESKKVERRRSEVGGRGTVDMIENCKEVGNPLPQYVEDENNFSVILPLKNPTPTIIFYN